MNRTALVGATGFVGSTLQRQCRFDALYNSRNIDTIAGQSFDRLVCAAAPATMWAANQDPAADKAKLTSLVGSLSSVKVGTFVLISTIAVLDDAAAGYTEATARYETEKAYGRHRRELEEAIAARFERCRILRLPALFGPGLKKNFVFDLLNPLPSFIRPDTFDTTRAAFSPADQTRLDTAYSFDEALGMWALDRAALERSPEREPLTAAFAAIGFVARNFTNSASRFQYYNMARLAADIDRAVEAELDLVHVCSEPVSAAEVVRELTGETFENAGPAVVNEDMQSIHADVYGGPAPYLIGRSEVLADLKAYYTAQAGAAA